MQCIHEWDAQVLNTGLEVRVIHRDGRKQDVRLRL